MKQLVLLTLLLLNTFISTAQQNETITVTGAKLYDFIATESYRYPAFENAKVYFINADSGAGKLNYNCLIQTMQFISSSGDTLVFADESNIDRIGIGSDSFIYNNGFFEKLATIPGYTLAKRRSLKVKGGPKKLGAFGIASATNNIQSEDVARGFGYAAPLDVNEIFTFEQKTSWYIITAGSPFVELTKKNTRALFHKNSNEVNDFIKAKQIDFAKESDILRLFSFIGSLPH